MPPKAAERPRSGKGFNWVCAKFWFCVLLRGLENLESPFGKVLILFVRDRCLGMLIRGSQNLETPGKGVRVGTFCGVQKVPQKHAEGCDPLDSRGRFKALSEKISAKFSNGTSRNRFFVQNGGEKALNRCDVRVLQRKDLGRTTKEQPYSLQTVGYGWAEKGGGGQKEQPFQLMQSQLIKKNLFSAQQNSNFPPRPN